MGIQKDAGELLLFFYDEFKHEKIPVRTKDVLEATKWDIHRVKMAYTYLMI
ncbi:Uncharacterised protein [uncultured archaeon]|nr:Uncharacterised protein [uncultured archaeon]